MYIQEKHAFTLIELLIVVAIIGILAAIAVPNFLNAQIRAKVARVTSELKTVSTAVEMYRIDNNQVPFYLNPHDMDPAPHFLPYRLTTPVPHLSSLFNEVFPARNAPESIHEEHEFHYFNRPQSPQIVTAKANAYSEQTRGAGERYMWFSFSHGPDTWGDGAEIIYDPTNGIRSSGDIAIFGA